MPILPFLCVREKPHVLENSPQQKLDKPAFKVTKYRTRFKLVAPTDKCDVQCVPDRPICLLSSYLLGGCGGPSKGVIR